MSNPVDLEAAFREWWAAQGYAAKPNPHTVTIATAWASTLLPPEPEVVGPTDEELRDVWCIGWDTSEEWGAFKFARAVLARWGSSNLAELRKSLGEPAERQAAPVPVAVSERLPGAEDCDAEGKCWMFSKVEKEWRLIDAGNPGVPHLKYCFSHWLPAHALPLPSGEIQS